MAQVLTGKQHQGPTGGGVAFPPMLVQLERGCGQVFLWLRDETPAPCPALATGELSWGGDPVGSNVGCFMQFDHLFLCTLFLVK